MNATRSLWVACFLAVIPAIGCGGGGAGGPVAPTPPSVAQLAGSWFGVQEPDVGPLETLAFDLDAAGNITGIEIDGVLQPDTATLGTLQPYVFGFVTSGGGSGLLWVDPTITRLGFVDDDATIGVLERGTTALPPGGYADADMRSVQLAGLTLAAAPGGGPLDLGSGFIDVAAGGTFTGALGTSTYANDAGKTLDCVRPVHGEFFSDVLRTSHAPSFVDLLLGPSKDYVAGYVMEHAGTFPDDATFFGWSRQTP